MNVRVKKGKREIWYMVIKATSVDSKKNRRKKRKVRGGGKNRGPQRDALLFRIKGVIMRTHRPQLHPSRPFLGKPAEVYEGTCPGGAHKKEESCRLAFKATCKTLGLVSTTYGNGKRHARV